MDIQALLSKDRIRCGLSPDLSRHEVISTLAEPLLAGEIISDLPEFVEAVMQREREMTTQAAGGIALPHACTIYAKRLGVAIGTVAEPGLQFDEDSPETCRIFFLIAIPVSAPAAHLPLLSHLAGFCSAPGKVEKLKAAPDVNTVYKLLLSWKK